MRMASKPCGGLRPRGGGGGFGCGWSEGGGAREEVSGSSLGAAHEFGCCCGWSGSGGWSGADEGPEYGWERLVGAEISGSGYGGG